MANKIKGVVDIVILIDVTGSMTECINAVKTNIGRFIDALTTKNANNEAPIKDWRMKICGYRDYERDGVSWFVDNPFVTDVPSLQSQTGATNMQASGGGDEPESLLDALFKIASMEETGLQDAPDLSKWRRRGAVRRCIAFFTDATYKRSLAIPEAAGSGVGDVINKLMEQKILLWGLVPPWEGYTELGAMPKSQMESIATIEGVPALAGLGKPGAEGNAAQEAAVHAMESAVSDPNRFGKLLEVLAKTLTVEAATPVALPPE